MCSVARREHHVVQGFALYASTALGGGAEPASRSRKSRPRIAFETGRPKPLGHPSVLHFISQFRVISSVFGETY